MSDLNFIGHIRQELSLLHEQGFYKDERVIISPQSMNIALSSGKQVINLCANNYLGLSNHPAIVNSAKKALDEFGFGLSSVRFICGTQSIHKQLEQRLSQFLGMEDTILYSSCFDANGGLFETLLTGEDAVISDSLNHASIIDGIRLCKAKRYRYQNNDLVDLEKQLKAASDSRFRLIATDGVFSMDGTIANLAGICDLADKYQALVMVDDSHATGFVGATGRGTHEHCSVMGRVDIITSTLGKALGGASGGFTSAKKEIVDWLRNRSRPYLFSNSLAPMISAGTLTAFDLLEQDSSLLTRLKENTQYFRERLEHLGFNIIKGTHPIVPLMLGEANLAVKMSQLLLEQGIYVVGFSYPVVPKGQARIRMQMSAAHSKEQLDEALTALANIGKMLGVI